MLTYGWIKNLISNSKFQFSIHLCTCIVFILIVYLFRIIYISNKFKCKIMQDSKFIWYKCKNEWLKSQLRDWIFNIALKIYPQWVCIQQLYCMIFSYCIRDESGNVYFLCSSVLQTLNNFGVQSDFMNKTCIFGNTNFTLNFNTCISIKESF